MLERELKLSVGDTFVPPRLDDGASGVHEMSELPPLELASVYYDTADLRLARHGITLRYRVGEEPGPRWTLKLPRQAAVGLEREELEFEAGPAAVPDAARSLVAAWVRQEVLAPAAALSTRRRRWLLRNRGGAEIAELSQDDVSVLDGERVVGRFRELELESRGPGMKVLLPIARQLQRAGAVPAAPVSKAVRALGSRALAPPDVTPVDPANAGTLRDAVGGAIASGLLRLMANDPGTRMGEPEALHQMRVATRRLRSDLRTLGPILDREWSRGLAAELSWLADLLGAVRDRDVELDSIASIAAELEIDLSPLHADIAAAREKAQSEAIAALGSARYLHLVERLVEAARQPMLGAIAEDAAPRKRLRALAERSLRRLRRSVPDDVRRLDDGGLHALRVATKRARYASEAIAPHLGNRRREFAAVAKRASRLQDALGAVQDAVVLENDTRRLIAGATGNVGFAFAAGQLVCHLGRVKADARAAVPRLLDLLVEAAQAARAG